jgi:hypothetical protein
MSRKQKSESEPTAHVQLETARAELHAAEQELGALDIHRGELNSVAARRRELQECVSIARERLTLAQARFDEAEFEKAQERIAQLQEQAQQIDGELQAAREQAASDLRQHLNGDWLDGRNRFASSPPALPGLLGFCNSVSEVEGRRDAVHAEIRHLERKISERRAQLDRDAVAARTDARRRLIAGESVAADLSPWQIVVHLGFVRDLADSLARKFIPSAMAAPSGRTVHCLLPDGTTPGGWADSGHIETATQIEPGDLCQPMADAFRRSHSGRKASR